MKTFSQYAFAAAMCVVLASGAASANDMINNDAQARIGSLSQYAEGGSEAHLELGSLAVDGDASNNRTTAILGGGFSYNAGDVFQDATQGSIVSAKVGSIHAGGDANDNDAFGMLGTDQLYQNARDGSDVSLEVGSITADGDVKNNRAYGEVELRLEQFADQNSKVSARVGSIGTR